MKESEIITPEKYMRRVIKLALKAKGNTSPNPLVGAIIVKDGQIVGQGFHHQAGGPHAEINALKAAGDRARGGEIYLNLEPCSHTGRTSPCVEALIHSQIKKVFVGMVDPNPLVQGKGIKKLQEAGIEVKVGILEEECRKLNEIFIKYITTRRPFVILKIAASLDGKIATVTGDSRWITNEKSRDHVHRLRSEVDAVLVGIGTVEKDDPQLTCRRKDRKGKDPVRIIVDSTLKISPEAKVLNINSSAPTIIATTERANREKIKPIEDKGGRVMIIPSQDRVDLNALMEALGKEEITSVLIEGGSKINTSALEAGIVDKVIFFYAPRIIGGKDSPPMVGGKGFSLISEGWPVYQVKVRRFGEDFMVSGYLKNSKRKIRDKNPN